jgi:hypothetical protein
MIPHNLLSVHPSDPFGCAQLEISQHPAEIWDNRFLHDKQRHFVHFPLVSLQVSFTNSIHVLHYRRHTHVHCMVVVLREFTSSSPGWHELG